MPETTLHRHTAIAMSRKLIGIGLCLFMLKAGSAHAIETLDGWLENGKLVAGDPSSATNGSFAAQIVVTHEWEVFEKRWNQPGAVFSMSLMPPITKGQNAFNTIIFTGCTPDGDGLCSVTADFRVIDPKGKIYADQRNALVWNLAPPAYRVLQLSLFGLGIHVDPPDAIGTYLVSATVTDQVARKTVTLHTQFEVVSPARP